MATYTQLTLQKRYQIYTLNKLDYSLSAIAGEINVHKSTVSREFKRCFGRAAYDPDRSHQQAVGLRHSAHKSEKIKDRLQNLILFYLILDFSPEQIAGTLKKREGMSVSFQSIYNFLQRDNWWGGELFKRLRIAGKRFSYLGDRKRQARKRLSPVADRVSIHDRPSVVDQRKRLGDWEIDTVVGARHQSALLSITERKTGYTFIRKLQDKTSQAVKVATVSCLGRFVNKVKTITSDNGSEFALHKEIASELKAKFYFADPYSAWQRGTNENANGLIRQYFPKKTDFNKISNDDLKRAEKRLNNRPRKHLNYRTPAEVLFNQSPNWQEWVSVAVID